MSIELERKQKEMEIQQKAKESAAELEAKTVKMELEKKQQEMELEQKDREAKADLDAKTLETRTQSTKIDIQIQTARTAEIGEILKGVAEILKGLPVPPPVTGHVVNIGESNKNSGPYTPLIQAILGQILSGDFELLKDLLPGKNVIKEKTA
jgi:hypothetical protein